MVRIGPPNIQWSAEQETDSSRLGIFFGLVVLSSFACDAPRWNNWPVVTFPTFATTHHSTCRTLNGGLLHTAKLRVFNGILTLAGSCMLYSGARELK